MPSFSAFGFGAKAGQKQSHSGYIPKDTQLRRLTEKTPVVRFMKLHTSWDIFGIVIPILSTYVLWELLSLKLTAKAPKNGWLEYDRFLLGIWPIFRGKMLVSGRVRVLDCCVQFGHFPEGPCHVSSKHPRIPSNSRGLWKQKNRGGLVSQIVCWG